MTVKELITALSRMPPDVPVVLEGCDCANLSKGVELLEKPAFPKNGVSTQYVMVSCDMEGGW